MTVFACALGYFAYPYQRECAIARRILELDPNAQIIWTTPEWVRERGLEKSVRIFDRIIGIDLCPDDNKVIEDDAIEALELTRLRSLQYFEAPKYWISDEASQYVYRHTRSVDRSVGYERPSKRPYSLPWFKIEKIKFPSPKWNWISREQADAAVMAVAGKVRILMKEPDNHGGFGQSTYGAGNLTPSRYAAPSSFWTISSCDDRRFIEALSEMVKVHWTADFFEQDGVFSPVEPGIIGNGFSFWATENVAHKNVADLKMLFLCGSNDDSFLHLLAARALWRGKSRQCARDIIWFARNLEGNTDDEREFKNLVARDTSPERILSGLKGIRHEFSAWLAVLEPRPEYVPELIRAVKEDRSTNETLCALEHSGDERAAQFLKERSK